MQWSGGNSLLFKEEACGTRQLLTFTNPPRALRRPDVRLNNLALVPASLLPFKTEWQTVEDWLYWVDQGYQF